MRDTKIPPTDRFTPPDEEGWDRYLAGGCSDDECRAIEAWLREHPYHALAVGRTAYVASYPVEGMRQTTAREAFESFERKRAVGMGPHSLLGRGIKEHLPLWGVFKKQPLPQGVWFTLVVLFVGVVGMIASWHASVQHVNRHEAMSMSAYTTGSGQRANITLPDGNTVSLNVASRLEVPADYMTGNHTLRLAGEGLFTVTHRTGTAFVVIAGAAVTRVLGTRFVVRHYVSDSTTVVAVQDGKVSVRSVVLTAAHQLEIASTGAVKVQEADPGQFSFATGILKLNGVRFADAIPDLDRWYDADIRLGDSVVASRRMTVGLPVGTLSDLTELLDLMFNVRVVRHGRILTLLQR